MAELDHPRSGSTGVDQVQYNALGQIVWSMLGSGSSSYSCPANKPNCHLDTGVTASDSSTIAYDSAGNLRTLTDHSNSTGSRSATYVTGNRDTTWVIASGDTVKYTYDADGNRTSKITPGGTTTYTWSADGRLLAVSSPTQVVSYQYYPSGLLMSRSFGSTPIVDRYYLWDGGSLRAEIDSTGANRINEYVATWARLTGSGGGTLHYLRQDARGNVIGQFSGTTTEQKIIYAPLGELYSAWSTTSDTVRLRWKGYYWEDQATQMYYAQARWYDPMNHRFASEDPAGDGLNLYTFAGGDQANGQDPTGMVYCDGYAEDDCPADGGGADDGGSGDCPIGTSCPNPIPGMSIIATQTLVPQAAFIAAQILLMQQLAEIDAFDNALAETGAGQGVSGGGGGQPPKKYPCNLAGHANGPNWYAAQGKANGTSLWKMLPFRRGGALDAQAKGGAPAYANYVYGVYTNAAGFGLPTSLSLANTYAHYRSSYADTVHVYYSHAVPRCTHDHPVDDSPCCSHLFGGAAHYVPPRVGYSPRGD